MDADAVEAAAHQNLIDVLTMHAQRCGGEARSEGGVCMTAGVHPGGVFVNSAVPVERSSDPLAVLDATSAFFDPRGYRYELWVRQGIEDAIEAAALARGMTLAIELPSMVTQVHPEQVPVDAELRIVTDARGIEDFVAVTVEAYIDDEAPDTTEMLQATFAHPRDWLVEDTAIVVAYIDDEPQAAAMSYTQDGAAHIGWVGTRAAARGRGLGAAVTAAATRAAFDRGATLIALAATDMGKSVYERLGFETTGLYRNFWHADCPQAPGSGDL